MTRYILRIYRKCMVNLHHEKLLELSLRNTNIQHSAYSIYNKPQCFDTDTPKYCEALVYSNSALFKKHNYTMQSKFDNEKYKFKRYISDEKRTETDSNPSFKDFQRLIKVSDKDDPYEMVPVSPKIEEEIIDINHELQKAVQLLNKRGPINFKTNPRQETLLKTIISNQPELRSFWIYALWKRPSLLEDKQHGEDLTKFIDFAISGLQLSEKKAFDLITVIPHDLIRCIDNQQDSTEQSNVTNSNQVDVTTALINWQGLCEAHQLDPINTLADAPEILYVPIEMWLERISALSEYFVIRRQLPDLMRNNASAIFLESWPILRKKFDYFINIMHVDVVDIAKCNALTMDLDEIKKRFLFLERSGLYQHPVPNDIGGMKSAMPQFHKIVETPPDEFFQKVVCPAGGQCLKEKEYDAFVRGLTPEELLENKYLDKNKSGYEDLISRQEEEASYAEHGYDAPYYKEDSEEARIHAKGYKKNKE